MTSPAQSPESGGLVLDVSLSCAWCFADEASDAGWAILSRLQTSEAHVPSLWLWDTANVLIQAERRERITAAAIRTFLGLLEALPIHIDHAGTATIWHDTLALARAHRLTSNDAAYLELALRLGLPLASRDQALQAAARSEGVPLLPT
jgi:predicted nucleic acid-binding protein